MRATLWPCIFLGVFVGCGGSGSSGGYPAVTIDGLYQLDETVTASTCSTEPVGQDGHRRDSRHHVRQLSDGNDLQYYGGM